MLSASFLSNGFSGSVSSADTFISFSKKNSRDISSSLKKKSPVKGG